MEWKLDNKEEIRSSSSDILKELMNQFDSSKTVKKQKAVGQISILKTSISCFSFLHPSPLILFVTRQNKVRHKEALYKQ